VVFCCAHAGALMARSNEQCAMSHLPRLKVLLVGGAGVFFIKSVPRFYLNNSHFC